MSHGQSWVDKRHLEIAAEKAPVSLKPKRCACGKQTTVKQLTRAGKCAACEHDATVAAILPYDMKWLRHMLGVVAGMQYQWGARNTFYSGSTGGFRLSMLRLADMGLVTEYAPNFFRATPSGCKAAGMKGAQIKRAMGQSLSKYAALV